MDDRAINISLSDAQLNANPLLKDMVERVERGEHVVVKRKGKAIGRLSSQVVKKSAASKRATKARPLGSFVAKKRLDAVKKLLKINKGNSLGTLSLHDLIREGRKW